jgi:hypothetical protein
MKHWCVVAISCLFAVQMVAQQNPPKAAKPDTTSSVKQSVEMQKITDSFVGLWKTATTIEPGGFSPSGGTGEGRSSITSGPAGNSVRELARSHGALGRFAGFGLMWWDRNAAMYRQVWCDNMSPNGCDTFNGHWESGNLVFDGTANAQGNAMKLRSTYSAIAINSFVYTLEASVGDAPMKKMMTIKYERTEPRANAPAAGSAGGDAGANPQTEIRQSEDRQSADSPNANPQPDNQAKPK